MLRESASVEHVSDAGGDAPIVVRPLVAGEAPEPGRSGELARPDVATEDARRLLDFIARDRS